MKLGQGTYPRRRRTSRSEGTAPDGDSFRILVWGYLRTTNRPFSFPFRSLRRGIGGDGIVESYGSVDYGATWVNGRGLGLDRGSRGEG